MGKTAAILCMMAILAASCSQTASEEPIGLSHADSAAVASLLVNRPALAETFTTPRIEALLVDLGTTYVERTRAEAAALGFASGRLSTVSVAAEMYSEDARGPMTDRLTEGGFVEGWVASWEGSETTADARLSALRFSTTASAYRFAEAGADQPRPDQQVEHVDD